jgi:hypothetical protein
VVEILVALGIFMVVVVALLPQIVVGVRATGTARLVTQAKGVAQGQLERMRSLPFHIARDAGNFIDVLDYFYRDRAAPSVAASCQSGGRYAAPSTSWTGFVSAATTARCGYEPAAGAFYRTVTVVPPATGTTGFTVVTDTQFFSGATPPGPVTPVSGYDSHTSGKDTPPSSQVGVTVTVLYSERGTRRPVSTFTQIAARLPSATRLRAAVDVSVLDVGSVTSDHSPLTMAGGVVHLAAAVTYASTAAANLTAVTAGLSTGEQRSGASATLAAPPTTTSVASPATSGQLTTGGCQYACWGASTTTGLSVSAENGLPQAGGVLAPAQALVTDLTHSGLSFGNSAAADYRPDLKLTPPLVRLDPLGVPQPSGLSGCSPGGGGSLAYLSGGGYLRTTDAGTPASPFQVEACGVARASTVQLLPTAFAPQGVVQIRLSSASTRCLVQGKTHAASADVDYQAVVSYFDGQIYRTAATVTPGTVTDPLQDQALLAKPVKADGSRTLGDYVASWSSLTAGLVDRTSSTGVATAKLPAVVTVATQPVRADATAADGLDGTSVLSLAIGAVSCSAEDLR